MARRSCPRLHRNSIVVPAAMRVLQRAHIHGGPRSARGDPGQARALRNNRISSAGAGPGLCPGQNGNVRHLRHGQAHLSGLHHAVRWAAHWNFRSSRDTKMSARSRPLAETENIPTLRACRCASATASWSEPMSAAASATIAVTIFPTTAARSTTDYGNNLSAKNPPHLFGGWSQYMYIVPGSFLVKVPG